MQILRRECLNTIYQVAQLIILSPCLELCGTVMESNVTSCKKSGDSTLNTYKLSCAKINSTWPTVIDGIDSQQALFLPLRASLINHGSY